MTTLYGIKNCDTVKKARAWLEAQGIAHQFHDFRKDGLDLALLEKWEVILGWEALLNRRGTSWRKLDESQREGVDRDKALALMLANPSLIKRPVLEIGEKTLIGFNVEDYAMLTTAVES
ncbi:MAG: ArsC family reductase [Proteobacteria bacterium]|nr:ArsC family reductase [Pseudomonadota bacterium]